MKDESPLGSRDVLVHEETVNLCGLTNANNLGTF